MNTPPKPRLHFNCPNFYFHLKKTPKLVLFFYYCCFIDSILRFTHIYDSLCSQDFIPYILFNS